MISHHKTIEPNTITSPHALAPQNNQIQRMHSQMLLYYKQPNPTKSSQQSKAFPHAPTPRNLLIQLNHHPNAPAPQNNQIHCNYSPRLSHHKTTKSSSIPTPCSRTTTQSGSPPRLHDDLAPQNNRTQHNHLPPCPRTTKQSNPAPARSPPPKLSHHNTSKSNSITTSLLSHVQTQSNSSSITPPMLSHHKTIKSS